MAQSCLQAQAGSISAADSFTRDEHLPPDTGSGTVILRDADAPPGRAWTAYTKPMKILRADEPSQIAPLLAEIEQSTARGRHAAGFLAYEAAPAFDNALSVHPRCPVPLAWFGICESAQPIPPPGWNHSPVAPQWSATLSRDEYRHAAARILEYIAAGDTYQVNFTSRLTAPFPDDPFELLSTLQLSQPKAYTAFVHTGDHTICSVSPELFFRLDDRRILCRPMKGTAARGATLREDRRRANWLQESEKNRAENVMIVDMVRNDLGKIARQGSVEVPALYDIERHETLFQMTSTVQADTGESLSTIFGALFPSASVTGAPKVRTMQIIQELEEAPRGVYTGCIGCVGPNRQARFNVAIRTVHVDRQRNVATYGTGSGIVWDSLPDKEFDECGTKSLILQPASPPFKLLESLRWDPGRGYSFLSRHIRRLRDSAAYFEFDIDTREALRELQSFEEKLGGGSFKVRLLAGRSGKIHIESEPITDGEFQFTPDVGPAVRTACIAPHPVESENPFLHHKTTRRSVYRQAALGCENFDDVILWNENEELTETMVGNLVLHIAGGFVTPPTQCGLLAGTFRADQLESGIIEEQTLTIRDFAGTDGVYMINSVRGWTRLNVSPRDRSAPGCDG